MPRTVNIQNPDRSFSYTIPSVGEIWRDDNSPNANIFAMTDKGLKGFGSLDLLNIPDSQISNPDTLARKQMLQKLVGQVGDVSKLPRYNSADVMQGIQLERGIGPTQMNQGQGWDNEMWNDSTLNQFLSNYQKGSFSGADVSKGFDLGAGQNVIPAGMTPEQAMHNPQVKTDAYADYLKQSQQIQKLSQQSNNPELKKNAQVLASLTGGTKQPSQEDLQKIQDTINQINQTIQKEGITDASGKVLLPPGVGLQGATNASNATNDVRQQLLKMGIDPKLVDSIPDSQLPMIGIFTDYLKSQQALGNSTAQANLDTWQQALNAAKNDPDIQAKYGDALKMAGKSFDDAVSLFQTNLNITAQQQQQQFTDEQKAQAEAAASAGQVFSGFRQQAKEKLAQSQGGVIESTRAQLKKQISDLGTSFESKFGSSAVKPLSYSYLNPLTGQQESYGYTPVGGITGTNPLAQKADIFTKAQQNYDITKTP